MSLKLLGLVFLGGGLGAVTRFSVGLLVGQWSDKIWLATLCVNLIGSVLIFLCYHLLSQQSLLTPFIITGFLGALTTFSSFSYEVNKLYHLGRTGEAMAALSLNMLFGIIIGFIILSKKNFS